MSRSPSSRAFDEIVEQNADISALVHSLIKYNERRRRPLNGTSGIAASHSLTAHLALTVIEQLLNLFSLLPQSVVHLASAEHVMQPLPQRTRSSVLVTVRKQMVPAGGAAVGYGGALWLLQHSERARGGQGVSAVVKATILVAGLGVGVMAGSAVLPWLRERVTPSTAGDGRRERSGSTKQYDDSYEYSVRVRELRFRYRTMAQTLSSLARDEALTRYQRTALYDMCEILRDNEQLVLDAMLGIGLSRRDAVLVLQPLAEQVERILSRGAADRRVGHRVHALAHGHAISASSSIGAHHPHNVSVSIVRETHSPSVSFSADRSYIDHHQHHGDDDVGDDMMLETEISLITYGKVSDEKLRRLEYAAARIMAQPDDARGAQPRLRALDSDLESLDGGGSLLSGSDDETSLIDDGDDEIDVAAEVDDDDDDDEASFFSASEDDDDAYFELSRQAADNNTSVIIDLHRASPAASSAPRSSARHPSKRRARVATTPPSSSSRRRGLTTSAVAVTLLDEAYRRIDSDEGVFVYKFRPRLSLVDDERDFAAHVFWIRRAFELMQLDGERRDELRRLGRRLIASLLDVLGDDNAKTEFENAYDRFTAWLADNVDRARDDCARLKCRYLNAYDAFCEYILMDSFDDLENVPAALTSSLYWVPRAAKSGVIYAFVTRVLDGKIAAAENEDNHFQREYYLTLRCLSPYLTIGFLHDDESVVGIFQQFKEQIIEQFYRALFALDLTKFNNESELVDEVYRLTLSCCESILIDSERVAEELRGTL